VLARRLRRIVHLVLALGLVAAVLGFFPGSRVYDDANNCFGRALASLGMTEPRHDDCTASYTKLKAIQPAGGWPVVGFVLAVALGGAIVHRKPRRAYAFAWTIWTGLIAVALIFVMFDLHIFEHVVILWPTRVVQFAIGTLLVLVMLATPLVALVTREPRDSLPTATDRSGSR
jgi:hypothetical protein